MNRQGQLPYHVTRYIDGPETQSRFHARWFWVMTNASRGGEMMGSARTKEDTWERMWRYLSNWPKQWLLSGARFDMPWARTAEQMKIVQAILGVVDELRRLYAGIPAETVW